MDIELVSVSSGAVLENSGAHGDRGGDDVLEPPLCVGESKNLFSRTRYQEVAINRIIHSQQQQYQHWALASVYYLDDCPMAPSISRSIQTN